VSELSWRHIALRAHWSGLWDSRSEIKCAHTLGGITVPFGKSWRQPDRLAGPPPKTDRFAFTTATPLPQPISELASGGQITVPPPLLGKVGGTASDTYTILERGGFASFLMVLVPVMAAYNGFQSLGCIGEEVTNPQKNIPRAAIFGSLVVISLYMLVNWTYFRVLGLSRVAQSHHVASDTMVQLIGNNGAKWITVGMIISALGALHSNFLAYPRVPFAMARDGYFFAFAKRVQPSIALQAVQSSFKRALRFCSC